MTLVEQYDIKSIDTTYTIQFKVSINTQYQKVDTDLGSSHDQFIVHGKYMINSLYMGNG